MLAYQSGRVAGEDLGRDAEQPADCWESLCSWRQRGEQLAAAEVGVADVAAAAAVVVVVEVVEVKFGIRKGGAACRRLVGRWWSSEQWRRCWKFVAW